MRNSSKGLGFIAMFMIIGLIAIVATWIFFVFFKVHVTSIIVDVDSVNRYQEIPTTMLGLSLFVKSDVERASEKECTWDSWKDCVPYQDHLAKAKKAGATTEDMNCFLGNGPMGRHGPSEKLCTKLVSFYYTKLANGVGQPIFQKAKCKAGAATDGVGFDASVVETLKAVTAALPQNGYAYILEYPGVDGSESDVASSGDPCQIIGPKTVESGEQTYKLNEIYPLPITFGADPKIAVQRLFIGSVSSGGEDYFITWPRYATKFIFQGENPRA